MKKLRNIIAGVLLIIVVGCSGTGASVVLEDEVHPAASPDAQIIEPYQVIWMATGKLQSDENIGGGFAEASFATNGPKGKFMFAIRTNLPQQENGTTYEAWLREKNALNDPMIHLGALAADGGISYSMTYEENFTINGGIDNPHRYSSYLQTIITEEPSGRQLLKGDLKVIRSVSLDSPLRGSVIQ